MNNSNNSVLLIGRLIFISDIRYSSASSSYSHRMLIKIKIQRYSSVANLKPLYDYIPVGIFNNVADEFVSRVGEKKFQIGMMVEIKARAIQNIEKENNCVMKLESIEDIKIFIQENDNE